MRKYIVDGYNLLNSKAFEAPHNLDLENKRNHLIRLVKSYAKLERCKVLLIFDNSSFSGKPVGVASNNQVEVKFTKPSVEADELIKMIIRKEKNPAEIIVVSSDRAIQYAAKDHGAKILSSEDYCRQIWKNRKDSSGNAVKKSSTQKYEPNLADKEVQFWKQLFENNGNDD